MALYKKFENDLKKGMIYERLAAEYFKYDTIEYPEGRCIEYDFVLNKDTKEELFVEVKSDTTASRTGNLAIEYECFDKPSGINASKADYYVYFINYKDYDEVYKIPIGNLKRICKDKDKVRDVQGGDGNKSKMYLINKKYVKEYLTTEKLSEPLDENINVYKMRMPFGKYKGSYVEDLCKNKTSYLKWLLKQEWFNKYEYLINEINKLKKW